MIRVGDTIEVLEPEDKANYPYGWVPIMDVLIGTQTKISCVFLDHKKVIQYKLEGNYSTWSDLNLKLISRDSELETLDVHERIIITSGKYVGETDKILACYKIDGGVKYITQRLRDSLTSDQLKPEKLITELF